MKKFNGGKNGDEGIGFAPRWTHLFQLQYLSDTFTTKACRDNPKKQESEANLILPDDLNIIVTRDETEVSLENADASFQDDVSDFLCYKLTLKYI